MEKHPRQKILFLITKSNWGGAQRYVYDLATNLDNAKFELVVALGGDGPLATMLENAQIRVIRLKEIKNNTSVKQTWRASRELYTLIRQEKPLVLHLNSSIAGVIGALVGRIARVPNILFTAHGWAFNEDRPYQQKIVIKAFHWLTVIMSHRTIAVSQAIVKQMNWPFAERKMKVINPGRTIGAMYNRIEAREKITGFCPALLPYLTSPWIVTIAELHPIKRHSVTISAIAVIVKKQPQLRFIIIGEGAQRPVLEKQIAALGLTDRVFLLGNIIEAARFLKAFDIFVLASKSESYGYVLHEAGLAGLPVIATNVGGIPDIIKQGIDGLLIPPDNIPVLTDAITTLLTNTTAAQKLGQALQQKLANRTVAKMTQQTVFLYLEKTS